MDDRPHPIYQCIRLSAVTELRLGEIQSRAQTATIGQTQPASFTVQRIGDGSAQDAGGAGNQYFHGLSFL
jgi:hypothetical protein